MEKEWCPPGQPSSEQRSGSHTLGSPVRILLVEDYEPFRRCVRSMLARRAALQVIGEASDGLEAVRQAEQLRPDLIILDIGLPTMSGIEAARRIRQLSPESKILFLSQEPSYDVVQEALRLGAAGYVAKINTATELIAAVDAVCRGDQYIGAKLQPDDLGNPLPATGTDFDRSKAGQPLHPRNEDVRFRHEVEFYEDERSVLESCTSFVQAALSTGDTAIVIATAAHLGAVLERLLANGVDTSLALTDGRYIPLEAETMLATFMNPTGPDRERFLSGIGSIVGRAQVAAETRHKKVVVFGEAVNVLCADGKTNAAIELEQLWNEFWRTNAFHLRCAYRMNGALKGTAHEIICAAHSSVLREEEAIQSA